MGLSPAAVGEAGTGKLTGQGHLPSGQQGPGGAGGPSGSTLPVDKKGNGRGSEGSGLPGETSSEPGSDGESDGTSLRPKHRQPGPGWKGDLWGDGTCHRELAALGLHLLCSCSSRKEGAVASHACGKPCTAAASREHAVTGTAGEGGGRGLRSARGTHAAASRSRALCRQTRAALGHLDQGAWVF